MIKNKVICTKAVSKRWCKEGIVTAHHRRGLNDRRVIQYNQRDVYIPRVRVQTKKEYVPRILHASSLQNPRYFHHTSCVRSEPFHAGSLSFHVQQKTSTLRKKIILAIA